MIRVLVVQPPGGAFSFITKGFINAFRSAGIDARYWSGDLIELDDFEPSLYIGASAFPHEIPKRFKSKVKVAIHVNPYGPIKLDLVHGNDINEPQKTIESVLRHNPDVVYGYGWSDDAERFWGYWTSKHKLPFACMATAGDAVEYYPDPVNNPDYDVAYLGGRWPFKAHKIDSWLLPVIKDINIAIMGWGGWQGIKGYKGTLPNNDSGRQFLSSAKVCPCICEPHTSIYGIDIPERFWKAALCGSLPILDYVPGFNRYVEQSKYLMASNPNEYRDLIINYAKNPDFSNKRAEMSDKIRCAVLAEHTYHHRMANLCDMLGFAEESRALMNSLNKIIQVHHP